MIRVKPVWLVSALLTLACVAVTLALRYSAHWHHGNSAPYGPCKIGDTYVVDQTGDRYACLGGIQRGEKK